MTLNELLILIGSLYLVLGSLTLSGTTLLAGKMLPVRATLFAFWCWPYYSYRGLLILMRRKP